MKISILSTLINQSVKVSSIRDDETVKEKYLTLLDSITSTMHSSQYLDALQRQVALRPFRELPKPSPLNINDSQLPIRQGLLAYLKRHLGLTLTDESHLYSISRRPVVDMVKQQNKYKNYSLAALKAMVHSRTGAVGEPPSEEIINEYFHRRIEIRNGRRSAESL